MLMWETRRRRYKVSRGGRERLRWLHQVEKALAAEQMKEISPTKHTNMQVSGNSKSRAKDMKDHLLWRDQSIKEVVGYFDSAWIIDQKLLYEERSGSAAPTGS